MFLRPVQFFKWEQKMADYIWITLWSSFFCSTVQLEKMPGFFLLCSNRRTPTIFQGCYSLWECSESSLFPSSLPQQCAFPRSDPRWCWLPKSGSPQQAPWFLQCTGTSCVFYTTLSDAPPHPCRWSDWPKASGVWPVGQNSMESCGHSNISRPIISVGKLVWIECGRNEEHNVVPDEYFITIGVKATGL